MAITAKREDKFAFLFTGNISNPVYLKDMENVYYTLTKFYNYNPNNIWLVFGSDPTGLTDFSTNYPGLAEPDNEKRFLGTTDPTQDFIDAFEKEDSLPANRGLFNHILKSTPPNTGEKNAVLLYFTGEGSSGNLTINETATPDQIDADWLKARLDYALGPPVFASLKDWCNINVIMQQAYGGGFSTIISAFTVASFTSACDSLHASTDYDVNKGSYFTYGLCKALQFEQILDKDDTIIYADELSGAGNLLISLSNAGADFIAPDLPNDIVGQTGFAVGYCRKNSLPITSNPPNTIKNTGETDYYLGKPDFLIRDGNHGSLTGSADASPDIILSYTGSSNTNEFVQDTAGTFENKIQVKVLNIGTHPVRNYYVGVIRYNSGDGGEGEKRVDNVSLSNEVLCPIPMPDDASQPADTSPTLFSNISEFTDIRFPETTHGTIRAKAGLEEFTAASLGTWGWDYTNRFSEAQLNISYSGVTDVVVITPGTGKSGHRPEEKFAFLFSGNTGTQYENDILKVYDTLTNYYGYPKDHIWIVSGGTVLSGFTGSNVSSVSDKAGLSGVLNYFKNAAGTLIGNLPDILNNAFLYFTGAGSRENIAGADTSLLAITGGTEKIDGAWLKTQLETDTDFLNNCQVDIFCEQSYGGGFYSDNSALSAFLCANRSFTSSCTVSETSGGGTSGSNFTDAWMKGLKMIALSSGTNSGKYADELTADTEPDDNLLVSLKKAWVYAKELVTNTGFYNELGEVKYLGKPDFLIRDGNQINPAKPVYESPDIYLTHPFANPPIDSPNPAGDPYSTYADYYIQDTTVNSIEDNYINVRVLNIGTHPLREFYVGVTRYDSGAGGPGEDRVKKVSLSSGILCPIPLPAIVNIIPPSDVPPKLHSNITVFDDIEFPDLTHKCVRAIAQLEEFSAMELDTWTWNYFGRDSEAQRNIDYSELSESSSGGIPPAPIPPYRDFRGIKEHIYYVYNPFKEKRIIVFPIPRDYFAVEKEFITFEWFEYHENKINDVVPIKLLKKSDTLFKFELAPKESKKILLSFAFKPDVKIDKLISVSFDILMSLPKHEYKLKNIGRHLIKRFEKKYALVGGFTLKIKQESSALFGTVKDLKGNPVRNAMIAIQTVNKRQEAIIRTKKDGSFNLEKINPDVYRVMAITDAWHTKIQYIHLPGGKRGAEGIKLNFNEKNSLPGSPIKIIIDKIRIKDAHEPFFKGKGEFLFNSVVIPDKDEKRKQLVKIPGKGFIHSSAKRGKNEIEIGITVFEGYAVDSLLFAVSGKEIDFFDPDDKMNRYHRFFEGNPGKWYGKYSPDDERKDKENVGDWEIWYRIVML